MDLGPSPQDRLTDEVDVSKERGSRRVRVVTPHCVSDLYVVAAAVDGMTGGGCVPVAERARQGRRIGSQRGEPLMPSDLGEMSVESAVVFAEPVVVARFGLLEALEGDLRQFRALLISRTFRGQSYDARLEGGA